MLFLVNIGQILSAAVIHPDSLIIEDVFVVDSSTYNDKKIYLFNDGSWEYENTFQVYQRHSVNFVDGFLLFNEDLFLHNFKNNKVSAYDNWNLSKMSDTFKLDLANFTRPCADKKISSTYKWRWGRWHNGVDFPIASGTAVYAVGDGRVRYAHMNGGGYGKLIIIRHYNGLESYYAHLSTINVKINEDVHKGDIIGYSGNTGRSTGAHLHFEFRFYGNSLDPELLFDKKEILITKNLFRDRVGERFSFLDKIGVDNKSTQGIIKAPRSRRTVGNM